MSTIAAVKEGTVKLIVGVDETSRESTRGFLEGLGFLCFDDAAVGVGWLYSNGTFTPVYPPTNKESIITYRHFLRRFSEGEREALQNILATGTQAAKNKLNSFLEYLKSDPFAVDLEDTYIGNSLTLMTTAGILAAGRKEEILTH